MNKGVFWIVEGELKAFIYSGDIIGVAKSGSTYNHKKLWQSRKPDGCDKPYNYYPRGRVDVSNKGAPVIWLNPNIEEDRISEINSAFGLKGEVTVKYDHSEHYKCYLDDDWRADKQ